MNTETTLQNTPSFFLQSIARMTECRAGWGSPSTDLLPQPLRWEVSKEGPVNHLHRLGTEPVVASSRLLCLSRP
jgi:hypothetical protein